MIVSGLMRRYVDRVLSGQGVVYTRATSGTKEFTVVANAALKCALLHLNQQAEATSQDRVERAAERQLIFDPTYMMPEGAQVVINGQRWQLQRRTIEAIPDVGGPTLYKRAYVQRVDA